jgi:hypothetical protein
MSEVAITDAGIAVSERLLCRTLSNFAFSFSISGAFLAASIIVIVALQQKTVNVITLVLLGLAITCLRLSKLWQAKLSLANAREHSPDVRWFLSQITGLRLAVFTLLGALAGTIALLAGIASTALLKVELGAVPSFSVLGFKLYVTAVAGALLLLAGLWVCRMAAKLWAGHQVQARKPNM